MLKIINDLVHFFKDSSRKINVREYAKLRKISPPTASKLLSHYQKEGLLLKEEFRNYLFFSANHKNKTFQDLKKIYQRER